MRDDPGRGEYPVSQYTSILLIYMLLQLRLTCRFESPRLYLYHSSSRHIQAIHVVSGSGTQDWEPIRRLAHVFRKSNIQSTRNSHSLYSLSN